MLHLYFSFFSNRMNWIILIVVQPSPQPNFRTFPCQTLRPPSLPTTCPFWDLWVFPSLWVCFCSANKFICILFLRFHIWVTLHFSSRDYFNRGMFIFIHNFSKACHYECQETDTINCVHVFGRGFRCFPRSQSPSSSEGSGCLNTG